jgi:Fur family transcriptional regulator, peroxide stress response regulator
LPILDTANGLFKNYYYLIIDMGTSDKSDNCAIEALRSKGYKATPQRIAICRVVLNNREHPTAKAIYDKVKKLYPTVSLATVYKTLEVLRELNLVQELNFPKGHARFDSYIKPHVNLICQVCGSIKDIDDPTAREITHKVSESTNFKPNGQRIDVYGTCLNCSKRCSDTISK